MSFSPPGPHLDVVSFGPFLLYATERRLEKDGVPVPIGSRALDILIVLVERAGESVGNRELQARVWRDVIVEDSSLRVNIAGLRRALDDGRDGARYVANIPGQGYRFIAPVARSARPAAAGQDGAARSPWPLPRRLARMVGRDEQVAALAEDLLAHRFVCIVGPGGIGKTTASVAVAHALLPHFDGQVCFFDLGALSAPTLLAGTMAATLGVMMTAAGDPMDSLAAWLQDKKMLLLLDSCEHLVEAVAALTESLYHSAPGVFLLATSREALRVEGEYVHRLAPLETPPAAGVLTAAQALGFPAVQLFVERAAVDGHGFALDDADAPLVAEICRKLDGIALAIELGAGRVAAFGVRGTAELLNNRFRLSWNGRRTALPRHQTLAAMLDWSYQLLSDCERTVLCRLSIMVGYFSLDMARSVVSDGAVDDQRMTNALASLVAKSLALADQRGQHMHYRLLDTVRVYALEKLRASGEAEALALRHSAYMTAYLQALQAETAVFHADGNALLNLDSLGNLRAGLEWSLAGGGDEAVGARLCAAGAPLLLRLSLLGECQCWCARALLVLPDAARGSAQEMALQEALAIASMFATGNTEAVRTAIERGLELARQLDDRLHELRLLAGLNIFRTRIGDFPGALEVAERSVPLAAALGDPAAEAMAEWMLGVAYHLLGRQGLAQQHCEAGLALAAGALTRDTICFGYDHRIRALVALARALWLRGSVDRAVDVAEEALSTAQRLDHPISLCIALIYAAPVYTWTGQWDRADALIEQLLLLAKRHMLAPYLAVAKGLKGELLVRRGERAAGIALLYECLNGLRSGHHQVLNSVLLSALVQGLTAAGRYDEAHSHMRDALTAGSGTFDAPEVLRIHGELLAAMPAADQGQAEAVLRQALARAREQCALSWELRAATTLAGLLQRQGRRDEARPLLAEVHGRLTEGAASVDYVAAARMLAELA